MTAPEITSEQHEGKRTPRPAIALADTASRNRSRIERAVAVVTPALFAGFDFGIVMAALWTTAPIVRTAIASATFVVAPGQATFLGLPLFLLFRSKGAVCAMTWVIVGFALGVVPVGFLILPMQQPGLYGIAQIDRLSALINGTVGGGEWVCFITPLIYFGSFGALGGLSFWGVLKCFDILLQSIT